MNDFVKRFAPVFLAAAVVLFAFMGVKEIQRQKSYPKTTGVITDISVDHTGKHNEYHVWVKYTVNGKEYEAEMGDYDAAMYEGKEIDIVYNPDQPRDIGKAGATGYILCFVMAGVALAGTVASVKQKLRRREETEYEP